MDLYEALNRATRFVWKGKQNSPLRYVRTLPPVGGVHRKQDTYAHVYASNGQQAIMLQLDTNTIPNLALDGDALKAGLRAAKSVLSLSPEGKLETDVGNVDIPLGDIGQYPQIMVAPDDLQWWQTDTWWAVEQVFHAVSNDKQQPHLKCIRFGDGVVEATDRHRVARSFVKFNGEGLVPYDVFKGWPKGDLVQLAFTDQTAWFRVGEETRVTVLHKGFNFPDLNAVLPGEFDGYVRAVNTKELMAAAKQATGFSEGMRLIFDPDGKTHVVGGTYSTTLTESIPVREPEKQISTLVKAKWMVDNLKHATTPRVLLGYRDTPDALRVESGAFIEGLWPLTADA